MEVRHQTRYKRQEDPADSSVPLAWVFKKGDEIVGQTPPQQYKQIVIHPDTWFVHCSFAGAICFLLDALGDRNVDIVEGKTCSIRVPAYMVGSWIGHNGQVVGFLKHMLGVPYIHVVGVDDWMR